MRSPVLWLLAVSLAGCASSPRIVATRNDAVTDLSDVAADLAGADVIALGEQHKTPAVHELHLDLISALYDRRPNIVIAMEMFERDVQNDLLQYLGGVISESEFLSRSRPWPDYARDYRPVIEFAKRRRLMVLAANAPAPLVKKARTDGLDAVLGDKDVAREVSVPDGDAYDAFVETMKAHPGVSEPTMRGYYTAQCVRDDTMAESITDYLNQRREVGDRPLAVLICGHGHSDFRRGVVQRIEQRLPGLDVRSLSVENVADLGAGKYTSPRDIADYVVVTERTEDGEPMAATPTDRSAERAPAPSAAPSPHKEPMAGAPAAHGKPPATTGAGAVAPATNPEGARPALGFMPDYGGGDGGVLVGQVRAGGPAAKAGIEEGDLIVSLAGVATPDVQTYTEVLDALLIGRTVTVRVRRASAEVDLQVEVGSRSR